MDLLCRITIRKPGFPSSVLAIFTLCNLHHFSVEQVVLTTKPPNANNIILYPIWRYGNNPFHARSKNLRIMRLQLCRCTEFGPYFGTGTFALVWARASLACDTEFLACLSRAWDPDMRARTPALGITDFLCFFRRAFYTQVRASSFCDVKTSIPKGFEFPKPVLLTSSQHLGNENQFEDIKGEIVRSVLVPCALQFRVFVGIALKCAKVLLAAQAQVDGAADVEFTCSDTRNAVDARGVRDRFVVECCHGKGDSLSSRQRVFPAPLWQYIFTTALYYKPVHKAIMQHQRRVI